MATAAGGLLVLLGTAVMLGWIVRDARLVRGLPDFPPMVFDTALCFLLTGAALLLPPQSRRGWRVADTFAAAVAVLATLILGEHLFQRDLGIDWPALHRWLPDADPDPGRTSPGSAAAFLLAAGALLLAPRAGTGTSTRALAFGVGAIGVLSLVGYLVSAPLLFPQYPFVGVAVHTATGLLVLASGLRAWWRPLEWAQRPFFTREDDRIAFAGAAVLVAVTLATGIAVFAALASRAQTLVRGELRAALTRRAEMLDELIGLREVDARIAATRPAAAHNLRVIHAGADDGSNIANLNAVVQSFLKQGFSAVGYYDVEGSLVAGGGEFVRSPAMSVTLSTPDRGDLLWDGGFVLRHRLPVYDVGGRVGEVHVEQRPPVLTRLATQPPGAAETGDMGICARQGTQLKCFPRRLNPRPFIVSLADRGGAFLSAASALRGESGTMIARDELGQQVFAAYGPVPKLGLGMVMKVDAAEILRPVREQLLVVVGLLTALVACGALLLRSQVRPLVSRLLDAGAALTSLNRELETRVEERTAALRNAQASYRAVFENSVVGIFVVHPDGRVTSASPALVRMLGYESAHDMLSGITSVARQIYVDKGDRGRFHELLRRDGMVEGFETRWRRKDGGVIWVSLNARVVGQGSIGHIGTAEDITRRKNDEEAVQRFRLALDNSADIILIIDRATMRYVDANQTACRLLGYTREELLRMGPDQLLQVTRGELEKAYDALIAQPSRAGVMNSHYRCRDGSLLPFESTRHVLRSGDGWLIAAVSRDMRERLAVEKALLEREAQYRTTFELAGSGIAHVDMNGRFMRVNPKLCEILGYAEEELVGMSVKDISHADDRDITDAHRARLHAGEAASMSFEKRYLHKDGSVVWVDLSVALQRDGDGRPLYEISILNDITPRRVAEQRIERLNRVYAVLSGINGAIVRIRDRQELFHEACRIAVEAGRFRVAWIGIADGERHCVTPVAWNDFGSGFMAALKDRLSTADGATNPSALALRGKQPFVSNDIEQDPRILLKKEHNSLGIRAVAILPLMVSGEAAGVLGLHSSEAGFFDDEEMKLLRELAGDIAFALDHIHKEERLEYLAYYDSLTGLTNRALFLERLAQRTSTARGDRRKFALCIFNVERFKNINDSLGRQAGDDLLKQIAQRLLGTVADPKHVARIGADQFAVLMPDARDEQQIAHSVERKLERLDGEAFALGQSTVRISTKAGIAVYPADADDAETLFRNAEAALRKAKSGGAPYLYYAPEMTARVLEKLTLENKLHLALEREEFVLHYQPKVDLDTRAVLGVEALIRWRSPETGLVPPLQFIPLLEETGLILEVGAWALRRAAADHRRWAESGLRPPRVAVNVSPLQLRQRDFVAAVEQAILEGVEPAGIDLEITESVIMDDIQGNIEKLKAARALGVNIAIDDFGTGYSSLGYLARLPVQSLKIDRSFVVAMHSDPNAATLVQTILSLAHSLKLKVVAEGVETEEQAKLLRLLRCDEMQGYLFSKPLPEPELVALLRRNAPAA